MNKLDEIIENKYAEVSVIKNTFTKASFKKNLQKPGLSIIAEVKRASPSKGDLSDIQDPVALASKYANAGAQAISVLTDEKYFKGTLSDMQKVSQSLCAKDVAVLRKDFIVDSYQVAEGVAAGASAVLLIVAVLGERLASFISLCKLLEIDALVEVHDETECNIAINASAEIIGINNRNLKTFEVNTDTAFAIIKNIPEGVVTVAESGVKDPNLAQQYYQAGFDAVLVGEMLVTSGDPGQLIKKMRGDND